MNNLKIALRWTLMIIPALLIMLGDEAYEWITWLDRNLPKVDVD